MVLFPFNKLNVIIILSLWYYFVRKSALVSWHPLQTIVSYLVDCTMNRTRTIMFNMRVVIKLIIVTYTHTHTHSLLLKNLCY